MDVQPAHLNRDSFRDSFKGLVAFEIIIDLPFGFFPINNIISLLYKWCLVGDLHARKCASEPVTRPGVPADPCERAVSMLFISEPCAYVSAPI